MLGALAGDIIGSVHEATATKTKRFPLFTPESCFTDDSVLSVAVAEVLLDGGDYALALQRYFRAYPDVGYGQQFKRWCELRHTKPYHSWGNGAAMRVAPVGWAFNTFEEVLVEATRTASVTHDHPEGIKGAQATAVAVFLARQHIAKADLARSIETTFGYDLSVPLKRVRRTFLFDVSCAGTVPWALRAFLEGDDYEDVVRNAISLGGDADTLACIAGAVAEAYYGIPPAIVTETLARLDDRLRAVVVRFTQRFGGGQQST